MSRPGAPGFPALHPFERAPHATLLRLTLPVLVSLLTEPFAGIADTFFIARLGDAPLAALGVATTLLSSVFWVFNFLGVGTQTEVARSAGRDEVGAARDAAGVALLLAALLGAGLGVAAWPFSAPVAEWMGAAGDVNEAATLYLQIRLLGAPAMLVTLTGFGALRGLQDMRTPLAIALVSNALNVALDPLLIWGAGPIPALGVAGAAVATTLAQWCGAVWTLLAVRRELGLPRRVRVAQARALLVVGRDLVARTAALLLFQLLATRKANQIGIASGAAHQVVRQMWMLSAFVLDAYATAAQSLIGYFAGARRLETARRVAAVSCQWGFATGIALAVGLAGLQGAVELAFVPPGAREDFAGAWLAFAWSQPAGAISFLTDGIHWGTGDYAYLRNAMLVATASGLLGLALIEGSPEGALVQVWLVTAAFLTIRAVFGFVRVWPGVGRAPLALPGAL